MKGGAALLLALGILGASLTVAFLAHRIAIRALAAEGGALLGSRAALAADSALAWFLEEGWKLVPPPGQDAPGEVVPIPPYVFAREPAQDGEIHVRFLGPSSQWPGTQLWRLTVVGRVRGPKAFVQTREVYVTVPDERGPPTKRAWRILR